MADPAFFSVAGPDSGEISFRPQLDRTEPATPSRRTRVFTAMGAFSEVSPPGRLRPMKTAMGSDEGK
ncbi:hypothetical protein GCM10010151_57150 [Actinoallomurus spadix]|uniref:Uncharacterized protein n=1 Tax=Actinoallomurus spadix TaxID=79912 RepID=A0ABN0XBU9_9ACTN